ncbi:carbohydrate-binding domain-containing protein [Crenalkalicoccus roseus]|uniref:carbohydrate-binding domain-containing protein n=1 Tax=Crenalkalicoccus roseus TaxID=1485588 RepID=UPI001F02A360|nr:carbohydrate-binding domain-containing protein [Crenalkalicoccus roseus]
MNVLVRGQSNALLFVDRGGAHALERALEQALGVNVHLIAEWGTPTSTIHSATAFMKWDSGGQQQSLLRHIEALPAEVKANPTLTLWMHNEYDQGLSFTAADWTAAVRADAALVRGALGQDAATTPYLFVPVQYPHGRNWQPIGEGMRELAADPAFNASISHAAQGLRMDGDGFPGSSHMGDADARLVGQRLGESLTEILAPLASGATPPPQPEGVAPAPEAAAGAWLEAGAGADTLVLQVSQDSYLGDALYTVRVNGRQVGEVFAATAERASGASDTVVLRGDWGPGEHLVEVTFLNDLWHGTPETDRNLYVTSATYNEVPNEALGATWWGGAFTVSDAARDAVLL